MRPSSSPTTRCCCPVSSTATCTSTSRAAPRGRASRRPPAPRRPVGSRRSSTCRSTRSRPPRRSRRWTLKRAATDGKLSVDVAFWGGAVPDNLGSLGPLHAAGVRGFKAFLTPSGVDEFGHLDADAAGDRAGGGRRARQRADRARGGPAPTCTPTAPWARGTPTSSRQPARGQRAPRDRPRDRRDAPHGRPRARPAPVRRRLARPHPVREGRGAAADRRDVPALPGAARRGRAVGGDAVQVLPAHPRRRQPGPAVGGRARRDDRRDRVRPLTVHRRPEETPTSGCRGAASRACSSGLSVVWTEARRRGIAARRRCSRCSRRDRARRRARRAACSRSGAPRTSSRSRPTRSAWSTCTPSSTRTRSRPTTARRSPEPCGPSGCDGVPIVRGRRRHRPRAAGGTPVRERSGLAVRVPDDRRDQRQHPREQHPDARRRAPRRRAAAARRPPRRPGSARPRASAAPSRPRCRRRAASRRRGR